MKNCVQEGVCRRRSQATAVQDAVKGIAEGVCDFFCGAIFLTKLPRSEISCTEYLI